MGDDAELVVGQERVYAEGLGSGWRRKLTLQMV